MTSSLVLLLRSVIARFVPIVRTFAPIVAGAAEMAYRRFVVFNVLGGFLWVTSMLLSGYFLGSLLKSKSIGCVYVTPGGLRIGVAHQVRDRRLTEASLSEPSVPERERSDWHLPPTSGSNP